MIIPGCVIGTACLIVKSILLTGQVFLKNKIKQNRKYWILLHLVRYCFMKLLFQFLIYILLCIYEIIM